MFSNAKKVAAVPTAAKAKAAKSDVETLDGLAEVAALDACAKAIAGLLTLKKDALKAAAQERLIARGLARHSKPDTMHLAAGEYATGRVAITKRSTSSPLTGDELEVLADAVGDAQRNEDGEIVAVPGFAETVEKSPAMLAVNPAYASDEGLLKRIDKALSGIKGIPEDFILALPAEAKVVVSDTATDAVFRLDAEAAALVFPLVAGLSVAPAFRQIEAAWEIVRPLLAPTAQDAKAEVNAMLAASLAAEGLPAPAPRKRRVA